MLRREMLARVRAAGYPAASHNWRYALDTGHVSEPKTEKGRSVFTEQHVNELIKYLKTRGWSTESGR